MLFSDSQTKQKIASQSILQRIAGSDRTAVPDCLAAYGNLIWSLAKTKTNSTEEAERLTSAIFQDIWKYAGRFDPAKCREITFISLIAHHQINIH